MIKFIKFLLLAVGAFMVLVALLWVVIHLWWLILAILALFIAYDLMREDKEDAKSDQPEEKSSTSKDPFQKD